MNAWAKMIDAHIQAVDGKPVVTTSPLVKQCGKCKQVKPRDEFYARSSHSPGAISSRCKVCHAAAAAESQKRLREKRKLKVVGFNFPEDAR